MAGLGPAPMCAMLLADLGATVIRIDRRVPADLGLSRPRKYDLMLRNREAIGVDLKDPAAIELALELIDQAQILIEGYRPGVMERLGLGPQVTMARNPSLVYGRVTGWGQEGPLARAAGHDLNYLALSGALHGLGRKGQGPTVPPSVIGDIGGGALYLTIGLLAALAHARTTGEGQVVDAAMIDGIISMHTLFLGLRAAGSWQTERGTNAIDGGSHFYQVYECADGRWVSVAAVEPRFYEELLRLLEIDLAEIGAHTDPANWEKGKALFADRFRRRTRAEWCALIEGSDACFAPVLTWEEASEHPHIRHRNAFIAVDGVDQAAVAPRFSRTVPRHPRPPREPGAPGSEFALRGWLAVERIRELQTAGTIAGHAESDDQLNKGDADDSKIDARCDRPARDGGAARSPG